MIAPQSTFQIRLYHGIWQVTLDGAFFGSYRSKANAVDGIGDRQRALIAAGRTVKIVIPEGGA